LKKHNNNKANIEYGQTKIKEIEFLNQSLRERDKSKDDSISLLADQIVNLTERLKEIEQKQHQQFQY
jgi:hypothetical protein